MEKNQPKTPLEWRVQEKAIIFNTFLMKAGIQLIHAISVCREPGNAESRGKLSKKRRKITFPIVGPGFPPSQRLSGCEYGVWRSGA